MTIANESIVAMMKHLKEGDRLGVILFDHNAYLAKPLRLVEHTDMEAIAGHILKLSPKGSTDWSAGYKQGIDLFASLHKEILDQSVYENRIIFLTDAMPNTGELRKEGHITHGQRLALSAVADVAQDPRALARAEAQIPFVVERAPRPEIAEGGLHHRQAIA